MVWWPTILNRGACIWYDRAGIGLNLNMTGVISDIHVPMMGYAKRWTSDAYFSVADCGKANDPGKQFSIVVWARLNTVAGGQNALVVKPRFVAANFSYYLRKSEADLSPRSSRMARHQK